MRRISKPAVAVLATLLAGVSHAACYPVLGLVTSVPDPNCQIVGAMANWPSPAEAPDPLLAQMQLPLPDPVCFAISGTGTAQFSGFSGLTSVAVEGLLGGSSATPLAYDTRLGEARVGMTNFTSVAALTGKALLGKWVRGTINTKDTGVITQGKVGQILKIIGGSGGFQGATGTIAVAGQEVGGYAIYTGELCLP